MVERPKPGGPIKPAPLLAKCLQAGDTLALFPMLSTWSQSDLMTLLKEIDGFALNSDEAIDAYWRDTAVRPEYFLSRNKSKHLDRIRDDAKMFVLETCSEISSVAQLYLKQNYGVEVPLEE